MEIAEKGLSLIVPAGIFNNVIKLDFINESGCADIGISSQWYAENVRIIQWEEITIAGPIQHKLSTATVGNINYSKDIRLQGVSMLGNTDRYVYLTNMMPGIIPGPLTMTFKGELVNNTNSAINLTFGSSQTFDAIIYDNSYTEVIRWLTGKFFTMAVESRTIAPGEKFTFQDKLELKYADNSEPIEEGGYTKGPWHLARTLAAQTGMTNKWLAEQGLISVKEQWVEKHYPVTTR